MKLMNGFTILSVCCLSLQVTAGCGPIDAGNNNFNGDGNGESGNGPFILGSLDEECDNSGLTGNDVLELVNEMYTATLTYHDDSTTILTLTLTHADGEARCTPHWNPPAGVGAPPMPASVAVDVGFDLVTSDALFDEHFSAAISSSGYAVHFSHRMAASEIGGTFELTLTGWDEIALHIHGHLDDSGNTSGFIGQHGTSSTSGVGQPTGAGQSVGRWNNR